MPRLGRLGQVGPKLAARQRPRSGGDEILEPSQLDLARNAAGNFPDQLRAQVTWIAVEPQSTMQDTVVPRPSGPGPTSKRPPTLSASAIMFGNPWLRPA